MEDHADHHQPEDLPDRGLSSRGGSDRGEGLIGTFAGFLVLLALLLFAVQSLVALHTRSAVTDAAFEGARQVAGARVDHEDLGAVLRAAAVAESTVRRHLGPFGRTIVLDWTGTTGDVVALTVRARPPGFLWAALEPLGTALITRTVHVRIERMR